MANRSPPNGHEPRDAILSDLFGGRVSAQLAAERLASLTLEDAAGVESGLSVTWASIMVTAYDAPDLDHLEKLKDLLVSMAKLSPPKDESGNVLSFYGLSMWTDLPMFGWEINDEWNGPDVPKEEGPNRTKGINRFSNVNKFTALLHKSGMHAFSDFNLYLLYTMSGALETPVAKATISPPGVFIPAAAALLPLIGAEMYTWVEDFARPGGEASPGDGGPLWTGEPRFCKERWQLWRTRFGELSLSDELSDDLRRMARDAEVEMAAIEGRSQ